ncbi:MAG TPA: FkbM family methyltransferase [Gemmatimonadales bacterium]|nr:FkbM family methyltransferase [Gemmatimonadales bacterium]
MPVRSRSWIRRTWRKLSGWLVYRYRIARRSIITIEGIRIRVGKHMSRRVERALSRGGYEREELRLIGEVLTPEDVVLEVGAGLGLVSSYCAKRIGSHRVFAYEADPELEPCIRETYELNGVAPTLEMCAVGPRAGRITLYRDKHLVSSSVVRRRVGSRPVEVPGKALNYVVEKVRPTIVVIDAEGAEREMFEGAALPTVNKIVLELHDRVIGPEGTDRVKAQLAELGFEVDQALSSPEHLVLGRIQADSPEATSSSRATQVTDRDPVRQ